MASNLFHTPNLFFAVFGKFYSARLRERSLIVPSRDHSPGNKSLPVFLSVFLGRCLLFISVLPPRRAVRVGSSRRHRVQHRLRWKFSASFKEARITTCITSINHSLDQRIDKSIRRRIPNDIQSSEARPEQEGGENKPSSPYLMILPE